MGRSKEATSPSATALAIQASFITEDVEQGARPSRKHTHPNMQGQGSV